jgi:FtsZ-interacting cell division protein YlmF
MEKQGIWSKMTGMFTSGGQPCQSDGGVSDRRKNNTADNYRFAIFLPSSREEAMLSADAMKSGSSVVINGEYLDSAGYQRVTDFLDGAAYVLGGMGQRVSETVQVYVPSSMEIVDDTLSYYGNLNSGKKRSEL